MRLSVLPLILAPALACAAQAPAKPAAEGNEAVVRVETSPQLFATMCALVVAGYQAPGQGNPSPAMRALYDNLSKRQGPAVDALRAFYNEHVLGDPSATVARFVSFALLAGQPPKFEFVLSKAELPPDVLALESFREVLENFYTEQELGKLWMRVQPDYDRVSARLRGPVAGLLTVTAGYLREVMPTRGPRLFAVYVEPLVGNFANFRLYGDKYAVVVGPGLPGESDARLDQIRHAFLHFFVDPLPLRYRAVVESKQALLDYAARAPNLPEEYRNDFYALMTECLVRGVELRLRRLAPARLAAALDANDREGYVLVRPLYSQLLEFDHAQPSMSRYFPDLVKRIDLPAEQARDAKIQFNVAPSQANTNAAETGATEVSELGAWLDEGDRQIASQDAQGAASTFARVLAKYPNSVRALYGLAVASVLDGKAEQARQLFQRVVATRPPGSQAVQGGSGEAQEQSILAWSHVYLGRMADLEGNREEALSQYRAALAVAGAPEAVRVAAQRGVEKSYTVPAKNREAGQPRP